MKKLNKLLFTLLILFIGISSTKALVCNGSISKDSGNTFLYPSYGFNPSVGTGVYAYSGTAFYDDDGNFVLPDSDSYQEVFVGPISYAQYILKDLSEKKYTAYCRNPGLPTGANEINDDGISELIPGVAFYCKEKLLDPNIDSLEKRAYDAGILAILNDGYGVQNKNYKGDNDLDYVKTNLALRVYEMIWKNQDTNGNNTEDFYYAHAYYVNRFIKYYDISSVIQEINKKLSGGPLRACGTARPCADDIRVYIKSYGDNLNLSTNAWFWSREYVKEGAKIADLWYGKNSEAAYSSGLVGTGASGNNGTAGDLLLKGLKAALEYIESSEERLTWNDEPVIIINNISASENTKQVNVSYDFNLNGFTDDKSIATATFSCDNCKKLNASYTIYANNEEIKGNKIDFKKFIKNGKGKVTLSVHFTGVSPKVCEDKINYKFDIEYTGNVENSEAYVFRSNAPKCQNGNCQNFYVLYNNDFYVPGGNSSSGNNANIIKKEIKGSVDLCLEQTSCFNLYLGCNSGIESSCETYVEKKCCLEHEIACRNSNADNILDKETNLQVNCDIPDMYCPVKCIVTNGDSNPNQYGYGYTGEIVDKDTWYMECDNALTCDDLETGKISKYPEGKLYNYINYRGEFKYNKTYSYIVRDCKPQNPTYDCENPYLESDGTYTFTDDSGISHTKVNKEQYIRICKNNVDGNKCTTLVGNATCTDTLNDSVKIQEGMKKESSSVCEMPTKSDVTNCIINYEDAVGNSYEATKLFKDNKYCQVWCKEDYYVKLPGVQSTDKGRYFSLSAHVDGSKTCYTSKLDRDSFENDFEDKRQDIINNYNLWSFYNAASKKTGKNVTFEFTAYNPYARDKVEVLKDFKVFELQSGISGCQVSGNNIKCTYYSNDKNIQDVYTSKKVSDASKNLTKSINDLNTIESTYNSCTSWTMSYNFDPQITFDYSEEYMTNIKNKGLDALVVNSSHDDKPKIEYCETSISYDYSNMSLSKDVVDDSYDTCTSGGFKIASNTSTIPTEQVTKMVCSDNSTNGTNFSCKLITFNITKTLRLKETMPSTADFSVPTVAFTLHPSGTVVIDTEENALKNTNVTPLVSKLPISFATSSGVYNYSLSVKDLGEHYDTGKLGRIWGDIKSGKEKDSVVVHINKLKDAAKCTPDSIVNNGKYICRYIVDCPDCPTTCEPPCEIKDPPYCENDKCPTTCESCILNKDINYRPITPNDINPNDRTLGDNWNTKDSITEINTAVELKAFATIEEIQTNGETIYEYDVSKNPSNTGKDFAMKIVLDNNAKKIIRNYNNEMKSEGGYANNSLKCYDYIDGKTTYKNVFCYSELIDRLVGDSKVDIEFSTKRPLTDDERKGTLTQESGYFTPWDWGESTIATLHIPGNANIVYKNYGNSGVGPAWK